MQPSSKQRDGCGCLFACLINSFMCLFTMLESEVNRTPQCRVTVDSEIMAFEAQLEEGLRVLKQFHCK